MTNATDTGVLRFPDGFDWGVASASYQIEGAVDQGRARPLDLGHVHSIRQGKRAMGGDRRCRLRPLPPLP